MGWEDMKGSGRGRYQYTVQTVRNNDRRGCPFAGRGANPGSAEYEATLLPTVLRCPMSVLLNR